MEIKLRYERKIFFKLAEPKKKERMYGIMATDGRLSTYRT